MAVWVAWPVSADNPAPSTARFILLSHVSFGPPSSLSLLFGLHGLSGPRCLWIWYTIRIWHLQPEDSQWLAGVFTGWVLLGVCIHDGVWPQISDTASFRAGSGERMCQMSQRGGQETLYRMQTFRY